MRGVRPLIKGLTKSHETPPAPQKDRIAGYWWVFGEDLPPGTDKQHRQEVNERREQAGTGGPPPQRRIQLVVRVDLRRRAVTNVKES